MIDISIFCELKYVTCTTTTRTTTSSISSSILISDCAAAADRSRSLSLSFPSSGTCSTSVRCHTSERCSCAFLIISILCLHLQIFQLLASIIHSCIRCFISLFCLVLGKRHTKGAVIKLL